mmetsp:Transcript_45094/g.104295  ORF Transcript_45094/g.104295 Transcript_45094/m.104295 type:complete len:126 (+) Transcript_45094:125-502(+)
MGCYSSDKVFLPSGARDIRVEEFVERHGAGASYVVVEDGSGNKKKYESGEGGACRVTPNYDDVNDIDLPARVKAVHNADIGAVEASVFASFAGSASSDRAAAEAFEAAGYGCYCTQMTLEVVWGS